MGRGIGTKVQVYASNLRLLGCFLLLYFGGVVLLVLETTPSPKNEAWTWNWSLTTILDRHETHFTKLLDSFDLTVWGTEFSVIH